MRFAHRHDLKNYLASKRIAVIQKAHKKSHLQIQLKNNHLIDKKIITWDDEYSDEIYDHYSEKNIIKDLLIINRKATEKDLQRILKHSLVYRNPTTEQEVLKVLNNVSHTLSKIEAERIIKNLNYAENVLTVTDFDKQKYKALVDKLPATTSRKTLIERCTSPRQEFLETALRRGENYKGRQYTYKELSKLSRDIERYKTNRLDYETAILENKQAYREGYDKVNHTKTWIWSTLENTRHEELDGETIPLTSKFEVVNSHTGDTDYLLFPGDVTNDHNNCSNICNCACSYEIN